MTLHTYAIIDSSNQIDEPIYGLEGARVYNVPYCDIGAIVSVFVTGSVQDITKQSVLAHEEVIERLMERFTVLPVGFHTVYDDSQGLLAMMQSYYRDFKDNLDKLRDKVEFGIKVIWPSKAVKRHIVKTCRKAPVPTDSPNSKFIRHKFEQHRLNEELEKKADKFISLMDIFFSKFAAEKKLKKLRTADLLLDAVYLVEKDKQDNFKEAFEHIKSAHPGFRFLFSGLWPPYNFVALTKKTGSPENSTQEDLFDKVIQDREFVGVD
jgi:hypothetical protein